MPESSPGIQADPQADPQGGPATHLVVGHLLANAGMGGAENYVALLANAHTARGGRCRVIVLSEPGPISGRFDPAVEVSYLGYWRESIRNPLRFAASIVRGYRLISRDICRSGVQVLQTHLPDTNLWGLVMSLRGVCRVVITIHNNKFLHNVGGTSLGQFFKLKAYRLMIRRCGAVVAVSREVRNSLLETLGVGGADGDRVVVVDNGVPIPEPLRPEDRSAVREKHGLGTGEFWVVAAGRLTEAKNFQCLVQAARIVRDSGIPLRVTIGGEGGLRPDLEAQVAALGVEDSVSLPGNLDDLGLIMQSADLLAMPSRWEGLPLVLLEALARSLPVVGTRINGLADIITEGVHGLLVEVDDAEGLAAAMTTLARDPALRLRMGGACLDLVRRKYDAKRVYDDLATVYAEVADH